MEKLYNRIILFILSFGFVVLQPFIIGSRVESLEELGSVSFGFPIPYTAQGVTLTPMESDLPIWVTMPGPRAGGITHYSSAILFFVDVVLVFLSSLFIAYLWNKYVAEN